MSFLSGIVNFGKAAAGFLGGNSLGSQLVKTAALGYAVRKMSSNAIKDNNSGTNNIDQGVRLQIEPNAESKIPVLYGTAYFGGNVFDARLSDDNKTMWYALALSETTGTRFSDSQQTAYTYKDIYLNNQRIVFKSDGITADYSVDKQGVIDRSISGLIEVYCYAGDSDSGVIPENYTGSVPNAYDIFPEWTASTHPAENLVFAVVKVNYNRDKGVTSLGNFLFQIESTMSNPSDVLFDYLTNTRYGAGIPSTEIDTAALTELENYSNQSVGYTDEGLGSQTLANRYQINGLVDTANPVLENAENLASAAGSWISFDVHSGKWSTVINKAETSSASFSDDNILGAVNVAGTGLTDLYNSVKVEFAHRDLRDSADFVKIEIPESDRNPNEPDATLNITYDNINEPVQAELLAFIELKQSRVDLVIDFETDFSYLGLRAGDVIDVSNARYGFENKLFRITSITERQDDEGALTLSITALEYDSDVYTLQDITRFTRTDEDGIVTLGSIGAPTTPQVTKFETDARPRIEIETTTPSGIVEGLEYWITYDDEIANDAERSYTLFATQRPVNGNTFPSGTTVVRDADSINEGNFFIKIRGFNRSTVGAFSDPSGLVEYTPQQVTDAIGPDTSAIDGIGGLATALGVLQLLGSVDDLFGGESGEGSIFKKIFDIFTDETGTDLVESANDGSLGGGSVLEVKENGSIVSTNVGSINFTGDGLAVSSSNGDITVTGSQNTAGLPDGGENKDILAWNEELQDWQIISGCITCEFTNEPPDPAPGVNGNEGYLELSETCPANNFSLGTICPPDNTASAKGAYRAKFQIVQPRLDSEPLEVSAVTFGETYKIAKPLNTDFNFIGSSSEAVGTEFTAQSPSEVYPNGKTTSEIIVGKRYKIKTLGNSDWFAIGATSSEDETATVGTEFTARQTDSGTGTVDYAPGLGWVYGEGETDTDNPITLVKPYSKGSGSFHLYGTDGTLEQSVSIADCTLYNDMVEIPFADRQPGKDYYVLIDAGILTYCGVSSKAVEKPTAWSFSVSLEPAPVCSFPNATVIEITKPDYSRKKIELTPEPVGAVCSQLDKIVLTADQEIKKSSGSLVITERSSNNLVADLPVLNAAIEPELDEDQQETGNFQVIFDNIPTLDNGKSYNLVLEENSVLTDFPSQAVSSCDNSITIPAGPENPNRSVSWGISIADAMRVVSTEVCPAPNGNAVKNTNIVVNFNKQFEVKQGEALVYVKRSDGSIHQTINLNGDFESDGYGVSIYGVNGTTLTLNPTRPFKGATDYFLEIPAGVLIDTECDEEYAGTTDITWRTEGIEVQKPAAPQYSSVIIQTRFDRPVVPGTGKITVLTTDGKLLTQISHSDIGVELTKTKD